MDLTLTQDQQDLQEGIRRLCEGRLSMARVREAEATGGIDAAGWRELDGAGVFALRMADGLDLGVVEAAVVFEELGRALVPGPLVASLLAAPWSSGPVGLAVGPVVTHLAAATEILVVEPERVSLIAVADLPPGSVHALTPVDPLTPVSYVSAPWPPGRVVASDPDGVARLRAEGTVLTAALLTGLAGAVQDLAVAYVGQREQFGRPVGSFQAVKHLAADMLVRTELARSATYAAAAHVDEGLPDAGRPVAAAKVVAGEAAIRNGEAAIQAHGGMGFTWEVDVHLYLKRAWVLDQTFGPAHEQSLAVADLL